MVDVTTRSPSPSPLFRMIGWFVPLGSRRSWARTLADIRRLPEATVVDLYRSTGRG